MSWRHALVWSVLVTTPPKNSVAIDIPGVVRNAKPAVVQLLVSDSQGHAIKTGTGFFITSDGMLITNYHVVENAYRIAARTLSGKYYQRATSCTKVDDLTQLIAKFYSYVLPYTEEHPPLIAKGLWGLRQAANAQLDIKVLVFSTARIRPDYRP